MTGHYRKLRKRMPSCAQLMMISIKNASRPRSLDYFTNEFIFHDTVLICVRVTLHFLEFRCELFLKSFSFALI